MAEWFAVAVGEGVAYVNADHILRVTGGQGEGPWAQLTDKSTHRLLSDERILAANEAMRRAVGGTPHQSRIRSGRT